MAVFRTAAYVCRGDPSPLIGPVSLFFYEMMLKGTGGRYPTALTPSAPYVRFTPESGRQMPLIEFKTEQSGNWRQNRESAHAAQSFQYFQ